MHVEAPAKPISQHFSCPCRRIQACGAFTGKLGDEMVLKMLVLLKDKGMARPLAIDASAFVLLVCVTKLKQRNNAHDFTNGRRLPHFHSTLALVSSSWRAKTGDALSGRGLFGNETHPGAPAPWLFGCH